MKQLTGKVVRTNNAKTAHVEVKSEWMHPKYLKKSTISRVFACHDTLGVHAGDVVEIVETRQMSATKYFKVVAVVKSQAVDGMQPARKEVASSKKQGARKISKKKKLNS